MPAQYICLVDSLSSLRDQDNIAELVRVQETVPLPAISGPSYLKPVLC